MSVAISFESQVTRNTVRVRNEQKTKNKKQKKQKTKNKNKKKTEQDRHLNTLCNKVLYIN